MSQLRVPSSLDEVSEERERWSVSDSEANALLPAIVENRHLAANSTTVGTEGYEITFVTFTSMWTDSLKRVSFFSSFFVFLFIRSFVVL